MSTSLVWVCVGGAERGDMGTIKKAFVAPHREEILWAETSISR